MSPLLLAVLLAAAPGPAAASPHTLFDDCEANFLTALGAYPAQFSPLHPGDLGRTRIRFRPSNQRAVVHRDFGKAVWTLEIRGPGEGGAVVYSASGVVTIDDGATLDVELFWSGRTKAGKPAAKGQYEVSVRTRFVPHRIAGRFDKPLRAVDDVDPAVPGVEEAEPQQKTLIVDDALPLARARAFANAANLGGCQVQQNAPLVPGWPYNFYYGSTHSHSNWSDGGLGLGASCTSGKYGKGPYDPPAVYSYARNSAGMDYYLVNEHNHLIPDAITNLDPPLTADKARAKYQAGLAAAQAATVDGAFVGLYGMEWGTISQGGHVTLIETPKLFGWDCGSCTPPGCPASQCMYDVFTSQTDYLALFARSVENPSPAGPLAIFAHPQSGDYNNYSVDPNSLAAVQGIAVRSGGAFTAVANCAPGNIGATDYSARWRAALSLGFKLGPTGDHDAHCANWGTGIPTRTVYLLRNDGGAPVLTKNKLLLAHKARHFYATEDSNAQLAFGTADGAQIMGDAFSVGDSATMKVTHADPEGVVPTKIEVYRGVVGGSFAVYKTFSAVSTATLTESVAAGNVAAGQTYWYYAHVLQNDASLSEVFSAPMWVTYGVSCADAAPPSVSIVSPAAGSTLTCGDSTVAVSATDPGGVASVEVRIDNGAWSAATKDLASGSWLYPWASSQLPDGAHLVEARATDASCGNNVSSPVSVSVTRQAGPLANVQPASIDFGNQHLAQASGALTAKLLNGGCAALQVTGYVVSGANAADFTASPASVALSVPAGGSSSWPVVFTPATVGARAATLTFLSPSGNKTIVWAARARCRWPLSAPPRSPSAARARGAPLRRRR